jgi:hypothetical protein
MEKSKKLNVLIHFHAKKKMLTNDAWLAPNRKENG